MRPRRVVKLSLISAAPFALLLMAAGCSATTTETNDPRPTPPVTEPPPEPTPDPKVEACKAEDAALQAGLDKAHAADTDAVLAIRNPACGPPVKTDQRNIDYGLGVMLFGRAVTAGGGPGIGHGGDIPGYHTQAFYFPEKQTTIVAIVDSDAEDPNDVSIEALKVLFE